MGRVSKTLLVCKFQDNRKLLVNCAMELPVSEPTALLRAKAANLLKRSPPVMREPST